MTGLPTELADLILRCHSTPVIYVKYPGFFYVEEMATCQAFLTQVKAAPQGCDDLSCALIILARLNITVLSTGRCPWLSPWSSGEGVNNYRMTGGFWALTTLLGIISHIFHYECSYTKRMKLGLQRTPHTQAYSRGSDKAQIFIYQSPRLLSPFSTNLKNYE